MVCTAKTTYKVGDKVRILDAESILTCEARDGDILEVIEIDFSNDPILLDVDGERLALYSSELQYIEKVAEQVAKFKVGDKVRVVDAKQSSHSNGDEGVIVSITPMWGETFYDVDVNGDEQGHYAEQIELISTKPTKNQRITTLEQEVERLDKYSEGLRSELTAALKRIESLEDAQKPPVTTIADAVKRYKEKTPNEQRKAIIAEAKAFVESNLAENHPDAAEDGVWFTDNDGSFITDKAIFHVNAKKRAVTCLIVDADDVGEVYTKGIAKCAPTDVFNADIGKAIALGRALGLDVNRFEQAVQPTEFAVGQVVPCSYGRTYVIAEVLSDIANTNPGTFHTKQELRDGIVKITDDTKAQY